MTQKKLTETFRMVAKHQQGVRKPGVAEPFKKFIGNTPVSQKGGVAANSLATQEFVDDHEITKTNDRNGNGDDVFKATNVKTIDREKEKHGYNAKKSEDVNEKTLTDAEMKKRKEIADAIKREHPEYSDAKKMAIATAQAKKVAEEQEHLEEGADAVKRYHEYHSQASTMLKGIQKALDTHAQAYGKAAHWGHVGDIRSIHDHLRNIHDSLAETGEYAKAGMEAQKRAEQINKLMREDVEQFDSIIDAVNAHKQSTMVEEEEIVEAYAIVLEAVYESLEDEESKQQFLDMLESDDAFDELMDLVEQTLGE